MTIDKIINHSRFEDFANSVIEFGKLAFHRVYEFSSNAVSYCKDTTISNISKIVDIWNETILPTLRSAWENAKPYLDRAVEWVKTPLGTTATMIGIGSAAVLTAQEVENTKGKFALRALGVTSIVVGTLKLKELI